MGEDFTAKHFRTWTASAIAYEILVLAGEEGVSLRDLLTPVAAALGNTPAIARKSYVHPALIALAKKGKHANLPRCRGSKYLSASERGLIAFLESLPRSEEHTSELQSLMRISYAVYCLKNK